MTRKIRRKRMKVMEIINSNLQFAYPMSGRSGTDYLVIHHAEAEHCTVEEVHRWHLQNGWSGIGYHFFVRKNGEIYRGRPLGKIGAHAHGYNNCSVGVCFEGAYHTADKVMPEKQMEAGRELLEYLREQYPQAKTVGHRDLMATSCPGQYFPFEELVRGKEGELLSKEYEELKAENEQQNSRLAALETKPEPMIYNYMDENMPEWARGTVQKLMDKGALKGNEKGELELTDDLLRMLVINDRMGLYGE